MMCKNKLSLDIKFYNTVPHRHSYDKKCSSMWLKQLFLHHPKRVKSVISCIVTLRKKVHKDPISLSYERMLPSHSNLKQSQKSF